MWSAVTEHTIDYVTHVYDGDNNCPSSVILRPAHIGVKRTKKKQK